MRVGEDEAHYVGSTVAHKPSLSSEFERVAPSLMDGESGSGIQKEPHKPTNPTNPHPSPLQPLNPFRNHILPPSSRAYSPAQRRRHVRAYHLVSRIVFLALRLGLRFAETGDPAFGQADADVDGGGLERCDHGAGAGGEGVKGAGEGEVGVGEVKRGGEVSVVFL